MNFKNSLNTKLLLLNFTQYGKIPILLSSNLHKTLILHTNIAILKIIQLNLNCNGILVSTFTCLFMLRAFNCSRKLL